jgi:mRNA-degrading endonuclease RelE of RelBE toxin-antitoxin system
MPAVHLSSRSLVKLVLDLLQMLVDRNESREHADEKNIEQKNKYRERVDGSFVVRGRPQNRSKRLFVFAVLEQPDS